MGTIADVFLNGARVAQHRGAYTRFAVDLEGVRGDDLVANNTDEDTGDCLPRLALARNYYKPYGGIYRRARLLVVDPIHVEPVDGTSGLSLEVAGSAIRARLAVRNRSSARETIRAVFEVEGAREERAITLDPGARGKMEATLALAARRWANPSSTR